MKVDVLTVFLKAIGVMLVVLALFTGFIYYEESTNITGAVVGKHRTGYENEIHFIVVKDKEKDKTKSIEVTTPQYKRFHVGDEIYVDYNFFNKANSIVLKKRGVEG